jgi:hypothetical protein
MIPLPTWMRRALFVTAAMNLLAAAGFLPAAGMLRAVAGFPEEAHPFYLLSVGMFVLLFGIGYLWTALVGRADRLFIALATIGKLSFFALLVHLWTTARCRCVRRSWGRGISCSPDLLGLVAPPRALNAPASTAHRRRSRPSARASDGGWLRGREGACCAHGHRALSNGDALPVPPLPGPRTDAPDGLRYVTSWVTTDLQRCFQVMECDDPALWRSGRCAGGSG